MGSGQSPGLRALKAGYPEVVPLTNRRSFATILGVDRRLRSFSRPSITPSFGRCEPSYSERAAFAFVPGMGSGTPVKGSQRLA